jgi:hypothetical protein
MDCFHNGNSPNFKLCSSDRLCSATSSPTGERYFERYIKPVLTRVQCGLDTTPTITPMTCFCQNVPSYIESGSPTKVTTSPSRSPTVLQITSSPTMRCEPLWVNGAGGTVGACGNCSSSCHGNCCPSTGVCPTSSCIANGLGRTELNCPSANCPVPTTAVCDKSAYNASCTGGHSHCLGRVKCTATDPCPTWVLFCCIQFLEVTLSI